MKRILFILLTLFTCSAQATTYYISITGNDATGTGTNLNPWRTLAKATGTVNTPGDIIHVKAGIYLETVQCFLAAGVSLEGDGITSVIQSTWPWSYQAALVVDAAEGTNGNQRIHHLKFDGRSQSTPRGISIQGRSNVEFDHCTIVDFKEEGVVFSGTLGFTGFAPAIYATGNSFHDNYVSNCSQYAGFGTGCLGIGGQKDMLIYNDTILQPARVGTDQIGWPIKYFNEGWLKGVIIHDNILWKDPTGATGWNFCVELFNFQGMQMYNNHITGSVDFNFQGNRGTYPWVLWFHHNIVDEPTNNTGRIEQGLIWEYDADGALIENNTFKNIANGITFYCRANTLTKDFVIRNNLFDNIGYAANISAGYFIGGFDAGTSNYRIDNFKVHNNTFIGNAVKVNGGIGFGNCNTGYIKNIDCRNNYMSNIVYPGFSMGGTAPRDSVRIQYNNIFTSDQYGIGTNDVYLPNGAPTHYTNSNNTHNTPGFVDSVNYYLKSTSLLRDAGTNVGLPYAGSAPDIGYAEFGTITNTPPVVNAGPDQSVEQPHNFASLSGSATDAVGNVVSFAWSKISGPSTYTITTPTAAATTVTGLLTGAYTFRLTATDDSSATGTDDVIVTVTAAVPPTVNSTNPANGAVGVSSNAPVTISFSELMDASTLIGANIVITGITYTVTAGTNYAVIIPTTSFSPLTTYTFTVSGVKDAAGNTMVGTYTGTFTTGAIPIDNKTFIIKGIH